jgi:endonuclease YncB( thermonuclease family)
MKLFSKLIILLLIAAMCAACLAGCTPPVPNDGPIDGPADEFVDYASTVKFDPNSGRAYAEVTVRLFVDGDTTHFNISHPAFETGVLKARYLAVNTPESTGQIEPWGKKASNYTKEALKNATSIIVESNDEKWNADSTGDRFLVWVWYKTAEDEDYRNLNLELLQSGLARSSKMSDTCYADVCVKIFAQASANKLYVHSQNKDPDFYYGAAQPLTLKELKTNIEDYRGTTVSFEAVVVRNAGSAKTAYLEEYDEETGLYFGIQMFYGYNLGAGEQLLRAGNRIRVVGSVQYYEAGGTYQIADIKYDEFNPDPGTNIQLISEGHTPSYGEVDAKSLLTDKVTLDILQTDDEGEETIIQKTFDRGFLTMHSSAVLKNLTITDLYTTDKEDSSSKGAISITCRAEDGTTIVLRTTVLKNADGSLVTEDAFPVGSVIDAKGIVDVYNGVYQLKIFSAQHITFVEDAQ